MILHRSRLRFLLKGAEYLDTPLKKGKVSRKRPFM